MYDKAKGILPPGQYLVGRDIPVGGYILSTIDDSQNSTYVLYKSYKYINICFTTYNTTRLRKT